MGNLHLHYLFFDSDNYSLIKTARLHRRSAADDGLTAQAAEVIGHRPT